MLDRVLVFAHLVALAWVLATAARVALRTGREGRLALATIVLAMVVGFATFGALAPSRIPLEWISVLQEGRTELEVESNLGVGAHAGVAFGALVRTLAAIPAERLRGIVRMNLSFAAGNLVLFAFVARGVLGTSGRALLMTVLFGACGANVQSAVSEVPSQLLGTHFLLATVLVQAAGPLRRDPSVGSTLAVATGALGALATLTRVEVGVVAVPATALLGLEAAGRVTELERVPAAARALAARIRALPASRRRALAVAGIVVYLTFPLYLRFAGWTLEVFHPLWLLALVALPDFLAQWLSWAVVLLFLAGLASAARRPLAHLALPWTLAYLLALYTHAANAQLYEMFRYCSGLGAPIFFVALHGWAPADRVFRRVLPARFATGGGTLAVALLVLAPAAGQRELFRGARPWYETRLGQIIELANNPPWFRAPVQRDHQISTRHMLRSLEQHPGCVFVTKVGRSSYGATGEDEWSYLFFGATMRGATSKKIPTLGLTVEQAVEREAPDAPCVVFYRGLDCNVAPLGACDRELEGRTAIESVSIPASPFCDPAEYGVIAPILHLGVYEVAGHAREVSPASPR